MQRQMYKQGGLLYSTRNEIFLRYSFNIPRLTWHYFLTTPCWDISQNIFTQNITKLSSRLLHSIFTEILQAQMICLQSKHQMNEANVDFDWCATASVTISIPALDLIWPNEQPDKVQRIQILVVHNLILNWINFGNNHDEKFLHPQSINSDEKPSTQKTAEARQITCQPTVKGCFSTRAKIWNKSMKASTVSE